MENIDVRNKPFEELTADQKIERMRGIIKGMQSNLNLALQSVEKLNVHSHSADGQMVIPYKPYGNGMNMGVGSSAMAVGQGYF